MLDYATEWGTDNRETLVLLAGAGATRWSWREHAELLAEDWHVVAIDLPAHGTHPDSSFRFERAVEDVGGVLDEVDGAVVAGHSLGGYVTLRAAAAHADQIDGVVLAGAAYDWRQPLLLVASGVYLPLSYALELALNSDRLTPWVETRLDVDDSAAPDDVDCHSPAQGAAQGMRAAAFQPSPDRFAQAYDGEWLIVHGEDEPMGEFAQEFAREQDGRIEWLDGGHEEPKESPAAFVQVVEEFLAVVY